MKHDYAQDYAAFVPDETPALGEPIVGEPRVAAPIAGGRLSRAARRRAVAPTAAVRGTCVDWRCASGSTWSR